MIDSPVFILGNPRSGTSLFRIILNAHPNIVIPPESGFLQWWYSKYANWKETDCDTLLEEYINDVLSSKKIEGYGINQDELLTFVSIKRPRSYAELSALVYLFYGKQKQLNLWGDKNNYYIHHIPLLKELYPKATYIHLVRDGRDVACSYRELNEEVDSNARYRPVLSSQVELIANEWILNNELIERELVGCNKLILRYEDVVLNFENTMKNVLQFLGVAWSDSIREYFNYNDEPAETRKWKSKTSQSPQKSLVGRYTRDLGAENTGIFERIARESLRKFSYME